MSSVVLWAPGEYWRLTHEEREAWLNGCGTESTWWIPDTLWGLCVTEACNIHDFMYAMGVDEADREQADRVFLNNLMRVIVSKTKNNFLKWLRMRRAEKYYRAVRLFGGIAFWELKNDASEMGIVEC
jgi:hypothetical protein